MRRQITLTTFLFLSRFSFLRYRILIFLFERFYISTISAVLISRVGACAWQGGIILSQTRSVSRISTRCSVWSQNKSVRNQSSSTLMTYSSSQVCIYIGRQWRNFFISAVFRHFVGQAMRNICYSDVSRRHFLNKIATTRTFSYTNWFNIIRITRQIFTI